MYQGRTIAAVIPAYKEEALIAATITGLPDLVDIIVVVDDSSPDDTSGAARATGDPRLTVIRHEENQGVGGAIMTAHTEALAQGSDINVVFAGDNQMDPAYLPQLLDPIIEDGYGFTKANRFFSSTSYKGMPRYRVLGNVVLSFLNKLSSGYYHLFDPQNGYTATTREVLERLDFDQISRRYEFENDFLLNLNIISVRAKDIPIPARYGEEVSGIKLSKVVPAIGAMLFKGFFRRINRKYVMNTLSPIALFFYSALALLTWSFVAGIWVLVQTLGPPVATTGTVLLVVVPFLMGFQLMLTALTLDIQASPD
jgi:glycosyltransferase involved in cell wall biosynthesis